jgi:hypothetical protein
MLHNPAAFPHQGALAYLVPSPDRPSAERVRIIQHKGDEVLVARELPEGGREARMAFHERGASRNLTVRFDELRETAALASRAELPDLTAHQRQQLHALAALEAWARETAAAVVGNRTLNPVTLAKLAGHGLTEQADLPLHSDARRRVSHYWLTERGRQAIAR